MKTFASIMSRILDRRLQRVPRLAGSCQQRVDFGFRVDFVVGAGFAFLAALGFADLGFAVSVALGLGA